MPDLKASRGEPNDEHHWIDVAFSREGFSTSTGAFMIICVGRSR